MTLSPLIETFETSENRAALESMVAEPPNLDTLRAILTMAIASEQRVVVVIRGEQPPAPTRAPRSIEGTPVFFEAARDGQERVVIEVARGATLQKVLLGRIERVLPTPT